MNRSDILSGALDAVARRPKAYGPPEQNFERIAALWNSYIFGKFPPRQGFCAILEPVDVAAMMVLVKVARIEETPDHLDSWIDMAGYAACGGEVSHAGGVAEAPPVAATQDAVTGDDVWVNIGAEHPINLPGDCVRDADSG